MENNYKDKLVRKIKEVTICEIEKEAREKNISVNERINQILDGYIESKFLEKAVALRGERQILLEESILRTDKNIAIVYEMLSDFLMKVDEIFNLD